MKLSNGEFRRFLAEIPLFSHGHRQHAQAARRKEKEKQGGPLAGPPR